MGNDRSAERRWCPCRGRRGDVLCGDELRSRRGPLLALAFALTLSAGPARAAPTPPTEQPSGSAGSVPPAETGGYRDPISVLPALDVTASVSAGALALGLLLAHDEVIRSRCVPSCDENAINRFDRLLAGRYSRPTATASDVVYIVNLSLPFVLGSLDLAAGEHPGGVVGYFEDMALVGEAMSFTAAVQTVTAVAVGRPRPYVYGEEAALDLRQDASSYMSFFSGHTAISFAAATSYAYLFGRRHPHSPLRAMVWIVGEGLAGTVGYLRMAAGYHYPTDVLVGAGVGTSIGLLVPWLHDSPAEPASNAEPSEGGRPSLLVTPALGPGTAGLWVTVF